MTAQRDLDAIVSAWLDEGPTELPGATRRAIVAALPTTSRVRPRALPGWRSINLRGFGRLAVTALVAVVAIGAAVYLSRQPISPGGPTPGPTPTVSPAASATPAAPAPTLELADFTSSQYGYTIQQPAIWQSLPATEPWPAGTILEPDQPYADTFHPAGTVIGAAVAIGSQPLPQGTTAAEWLDDWAVLREGGGGPCVPPATAWTPTTVAGAPARRVEAPCLAEAGQPSFAEYAWVVDDRAFVLTGSPTIVELMIVTFEPG